MVTQFMCHEQLKDKTTLSIVKAFTKIYNLDILDVPKNITFDTGVAYAAVGSLDRSYKNYSEYSSG